MKRIEGVIPAERIYKVNDALRNIGVGGITCFASRGRGENPIAPRSAGRGGLFTPEFNDNCSFIVVVKDGDAEKTIQTILQAAGTGLAGEGKVFVSKVDDVVDIGSKKRGEQAL